MFKLRENIEIILSFIYSPLKYEIAHCVYNILYISGQEYNYLKYL